jgi:hypothetical protein
MFCSLGEKTKIMDVNMRFPGVKGDFPRYYDHLITDHTRRNKKNYFRIICNPKITPINQKNWHVSWETSARGRNDSVRFFQEQGGLQIPTYNR